MIFLVMSSIVILTMSIVGYYYEISQVNTMFIDCVIARFNESISWIHMLNFKNVSRFIVYNKGKPLENVPKNVIEIMVPNVGKCDHTFLYHIITQYNNLADVTLFVSGKGDCKRKGHKIRETMRLINKTGTSVFMGIRRMIPDDMKYFNLNKHLSQNPENHIDDGNITALSPANIRPFGKWFNHFWPNKKINIVTMMSIFGVHRDHIIQHPIIYYENLCNELKHDVNPEAGHYMERSWGMVFSPYPNECLYLTSY